MIKQNIELLLASQSPRRRALLKELGFPVHIVQPPNVDEVFPDHLKAGEIPVYLSQLKAQAYSSEIPDGAMLVTADTIVWLNNEVIGKPSDRDDAIAMLKKLSGNMHYVYTGVCLNYKGISHCFCDETQVFFRELTDEEIVFYVDKYKPFDKAGAYGVQEWIGFVGVERIEGSYFNVMGLPTHRLYAEIQAFCERVG
ncbi:MAG: Maf-like protein [Bacteroidota bacterium]|nr:Maf-like protein [Bacteroidota bacterium]